tara:strand:+ start:69 stop:308 length:240 start_codon:yes stop_codon:yes gene_type:complete
MNNIIELILDGIRFSIKFLIGSFFLLLSFLPAAFVITFLENKTSYKIISIIIGMVVLVYSFTFMEKVLDKLIEKFDFLK